MGNDYSSGYHLHDEDNTQGELPFDLRQAFVIITTEIKKEIVIARADKDFSRWYYLLDSLFIEVCKGLDEEEVKAYEKLNKESMKQLSKFSMSFLKKNHQNDNEVYSIIRNLDIWINRKMNEKKMFGFKMADDGL